MRGESVFSLRRLGAIIAKEFVQMRRDRITFAMMVGIPLIQLCLFGYAINQDPRHLPTALVNADQGPLTRSIAASLQRSGYFDIVDGDLPERDAREALALGEAQFVITVPVDFERDIRRGRVPVLLVEADATDPGATSNAIAALPRIIDLALEREMARRSVESSAGPPRIDVRLHALYNPEAKTSFNIVPGLMGVILTMTMVMITALAMTRERERGTLEMLLSMPPRPLEVLAGKIIPYIFVAYVQIALILMAAKFLFAVPVIGSLPLLLFCAFFFVLANLGMGVTFSTLAKNQLQAVQMAFFFFLPSLLLSGFMFPFRGMPEWAQSIGNALPLTHFLRIVRGVMLKGNGMPEVIPDLWPICVFLVGSMSIAVIRYRQTLD
ncbi:ABC-2 type transporter family [Verrucomicrobiia bacterium DG1235]|nr:ABC-2 type transporter family [Verrucomicrobiae bacterium DG1235]